MDTSDWVMGILSSSRLLMPIFALLVIGGLLLASTSFDSSTAPLTFLKSPKSAFGTSPSIAAPLSFSKAPAYSSKYLILRLDPALADEASVQALIASFGDRFVSYQNDVSSITIRRSGADSAADQAQVLSSVASKGFSKGMVQSIEEDFPVYALLNESVPLLNATYAYTNGSGNTSIPGYNGSDMKVCVIDTGTDYFNSNLPVVKAKDFTTTDWCIDGPTKSTGWTHKYKLNVSAARTRLEMGVWWCNGNATSYGLEVYRPNGSLLANLSTQTGVIVTGGLCGPSTTYFLRKNLTNLAAGVYSLTIPYQATNGGASFPTILWGSNTTADAGYYGGDGCVSDPSPISAGDTLAFYNIHPHADDTASHGAHVSGTIALNPLNATFHGVAPGVSLYIAKVLNMYGSGSSVDIASAIDWCLSKNTSVISMSLGANSNPSCSDAMAAKVAANSNKSLFVIAAGNNGAGANTVGTPGCAKNALTVAAVNKTADVIAIFSSRGPANSSDGNSRLKPEISGPGVNINSSIVPNTMGLLSGTSMATPHISGFAAILRQRFLNLGVQGLKALILSAGDMAACDTDYGCGLPTFERAFHIRVAKIASGTRNLSFEGDAADLLVLEDEAEGTHSSATFHFYVNGSEADSAAPKEAYRFTNDSEGPYSLTVTSGPAFYVAYPDNITMARLSLVSPDENTLRANRTVPVNLSLLTNDFTTVNLSLRNSTNQTVASVLKTVTGSTVLANLTAPKDEVYSVVAWGLDAQGFNYSDSISNLTIDTIAPNLTILSPASNRYLDSAAIDVNLTAADPTLDTVSATLYNSSNASVDSVSSTDAGNQILTLGGGEDDGVYHILVSANDSVGRSTNKTLTNLTVDTADPALSITNPADSANLTSRTISVNFTASDTNLNYTNLSLINSSSVRVASVKVLASAAQHATLTAPKDGVYTLTATAFDRARRNSSESISLTVDTLSPNLTLLSPASNSFTNSATLDVNFTVSDLNFDHAAVYLYEGATLIDNQNTTDAGNQVLSLGSLVNNHVYSLNLTAFDASGHNTSASRTNLTMDTVLPVITLLSPNASSNLLNRTIAIRINVSDDHALNYTNVSIFNSSNDALVNSTRVNGSGVKNVSLKVPGDDTYYIDATSWDKAGNSQTDEHIDITVDSSNPVLSVSAPSNNTFLSSKNITITFSVTDDHLNYTNVSIFNTNNTRVNSTLSNASGSQSIYLVVSSDGVYRFAFLANDTFGHTVTVGRSNVTVDNATPSVNISSVSTPGNKTMKINFTVNDTNLNYTNISILNSTGGALVNSTRSTHNGIQLVTLKVPATGNYNISVTAYDKAGHSFGITQGSYSVSMLAVTVSPDQYISRVLLPPAESKVEN